MPKDDADSEKWVMEDHTQIKHRILENYLVPWTRILSSGNPRIHYFDGFAGRGRYEEGEPGSPILALQVANEHAELFDTFLCTFIEKDPENYADLVAAIDEIEEECAENIEIHIHNDTFANVARELMENLEGEIVPSFFFIDPFGYEGVPFEVVSDIINLRETGVEVFLTFMVHYIRRFISDESKSAAITEILGTDDWTAIRDNPDTDNVENEILKIYESQLASEAGVDYVWPFEMRRPDRRTTEYYLIHATNHFKGFKIMKDVMFKAGAEGQFGYLGPDHYGFDSEQQRLFEAADKIDRRVRNLADFIFEQLEGERVRFWDVMKRTYTSTDLIEKHYREAIYLLEEQKRATIHNYPSRPRGTGSGLGHGDEVEFESPNTPLSDFT